MTHQCGVRTFLRCIACVLFAAVSSDCTIVRRTSEGEP